MFRLFNKVGVTKIETNVLQINVLRIGDLQTVTCLNR